MSAERRKVLEMVAAGKLTPEEAERLLGRLASLAGEEDAEGEGARAPGGEGDGPRRGLRFLRVVVDSPHGDSVDVRLPLGLVRTGLKLSTLVPGRIGRRLSERGIDLSHLGDLDHEALITELAALQVDIADEDGEKVRMFCE